MATDLCRQLKINSRINWKLTFRHNLETDRTIIYRLGKKNEKNAKEYFTEMYFVIKDLETQVYIYNNANWNLDTL